jgi:hypothetical protein
MKQTPAHDRHNPDLLRLMSKNLKRVVEGFSRVADEPRRQSVLPSIRAMAVATGTDPQLAENDSLAVQYVVKAAPA